MHEYFRHGSAVAERPTNIAHKPALLLFASTLKRDFSTNPSAKSFEKETSVVVVQAIREDNGYPEEAPT